MFLCLFFILGITLLNINSSPNSTANVHDISEWPVTLAFSDRMEMNQQNRIHSRRMVKLHFHSFMPIAFLCITINTRVFIKTDAHCVSVQCNQYTGVHKDGWQVVEYVRAFSVNISLGKVSV